MLDNNKHKFNLNLELLAIIAMNVAFFGFAICFSVGATLKTGSALLGAAIFFICLFIYGLVWLSILREW